MARRQVLKLTAGATAALAVEPHAFAASAAAPPEPQNVLSPDAALARLVKGNARYVEGVGAHGEPAAPQTQPNQSFWPLNTAEAARSPAWD